MSLHMPLPFGPLCFAGRFRGSTAQVLTSLEALKTTHQMTLQHHKGLKTARIRVHMLSDIDTRNQWETIVNIHHSCRGRTLLLLQYLRGSAALTNHVHTLHLRDKAAELT